MLVQIPLQQLAWLLQDQPRRLIICGMGTAGAVAQHAALSMQRLLLSPISDEARQFQMLVNCKGVSGTAGLLHKNSLSDHLATVRWSGAKQM